MFIAKITTVVDGNRNLKSQSPWKVQAVYGMASSFF